MTNPKEINNTGCKCGFLAYDPINKSLYKDELQQNPTTYQTKRVILKDEDTILRSIVSANNQLSDLAFQILEWKDLTKKLIIICLNKQQTRCVK